VRNDDPPPVIWARPVRGSRGPRPAWSRDDIASAAVRIADADRIDAVSIRRVAAEIGATPTALYRYVLRKDELSDLMIDAIYAEQAPPAPSGDWRIDLLAGRTQRPRRGNSAPMVAGTVGRASEPRSGHPGGLDFAYGAFDGHTLAAHEMMANIDTLGAFVTGHALGEIAEATTPDDREQWMAAQGTYGDEIITSGRFPHLARVMVEADLPHAKDRPDRSFTLGLDHILDGLAAHLQRVDHGQRVAPEDR